MQLAPQRTQPAAARVVGGILLLPALVLTVLTLVIPTVRTVVTSLHDERFLPGKPAAYVGFDNFGTRGLWPSVWFALSLVVVPMVVAVVVAPLVAAVVEWAGAWARWTARIVLSLAVVVFSPVALALAWQRDLRGDDPPPLASDDTAGGALRSSVAMMTFGVVLAVGLMIFLPVFRGRRPAWPALFAIAGLSVLGVAAVGLQVFTVPFVMTAFGPKNSTMTPLGLMYANAFRDLNVGVGAAVATVVLAILAVLGVGAVLIVVLSRLRVSLVPSSQARPGPVNPGAVVLAALVLAAIVAAVVLNALPWFDALSGADPTTPSGAGGRTWVPAVTGALASVGVAYLAALGISGLRPLGRHSEWLLMPFAPWLFVGLGPLSIEFFDSVREDDGLNTSGALYPRILVSVLAMVILAVLCRGQSERWSRYVADGAPAGPAFVRTVLLPTLPLAGVLFVVALLVNAQDLLWPLLVSTSPDHDTATLALLRMNGNFATGDFSVASLTPLVAVVLGALALAAAQVFHLDRMVATTGRTDDSWPADPPTTPIPVPQTPWAARN